MLIIHVLNDKVALITQSRNVFKVRAVGTDCAEQRVGHNLANVFQEKSHQGKFMNSILLKFVRSFLSLAHGNADVEQRASLSANKKTVTPHSKRDL